MLSDFFEIEQLSEGHFLVSNKGYIEKYRPVGKDTPETISALGSPWFSLVGIDPLLVKTPETTVLIDAGLGLSLDEKNRDPHTSNLLTNLQVLDVDPASITHVVISHLHQDHVRGLVYNDKSMASSPTLPNAKIVVQRLEWEYALEQYDTPQATEGLGYDLDDLFKLVADGRFIFLEDEVTTLLPGIELIRTGGHTPGHQIVRLHHGKESAYFFGDLIPTTEHMNRYKTRQVDTDPERAKHQKNFWLRRAAEEVARIYFYHELKFKTGLLVRDHDRLFQLGEQITPQKSGR